MTKVLVVEDSAVLREFLVALINSAASLQVVATGARGDEALELVKRHKPDIVTMDIHMPGMDGFEATRAIMEAHPVPIVIVSGSFDSDEVALTFRAIEAGAVAFVPRPGSLQRQDQARDLLQTLKLMAEIKVVRRRGRVRPPGAAALQETEKPAPGQARLIAIGASTGGPGALKTILAGLPEDFGVPVLVVQHIASGFLSGFADWLAGATKLQVRVPADGERLAPAHVYVAPDGMHMGVDARGRRIRLVRGDPAQGLCPSVAHLFESVARAYGADAVGVLLSGMGKDGAHELKALRDLGGVTIAQDETSCVVFGMPGEAVKLQAASYILSPDKIIDRLRLLVGTENESR